MTLNFVKKILLNVNKKVVMAGITIMLLTCTFTGDSRIVNSTYEIAIADDKEFISDVNEFDHENSILYGTGLGQSIVQNIDQNIGQNLSKSSVKNDGEDLEKVSVLTGAGIKPIPDLEEIVEKVKQELEPSVAYAQGSTYINPNFEPKTFDYVHERSGYNEPEDFRRDLWDSSHLCYWYESADTNAIELEALKDRIEGDGYEYVTQENYNKFPKLMNKVDKLFGGRTAIGKCEPHPEGVSVRSKLLCIGPYTSVMDCFYGRYNDIMEKEDELTEIGKDLYEDECASWYSGDLALATYFGVINGIPNENGGVEFQGNKNVTLSEVCAMASRSNLGVAFDTYAKWGYSVGRTKEEIASKPWWWANKCASSNNNGYGAWSGSFRELNINTANTNASRLEVCYSIIDNVYADKDAIRKCFESGAYKRCLNYFTDINKIDEGNGNFYDASLPKGTVSQASAAVLTIAYETGIISGNDLGEANPDSAITRAEALKMFANAWKSAGYAKAKNHNTSNRWMADRIGHNGSSLSRHICNELGRYVKGNDITCGY